MKLFPSLDSKDRKLLIGCLVAVLLLAFVTAFLSRNQNNDDNTVPSSYLTGRHGARAAYELLQASGYTVERWEQPLSDLAQRADEQTVVIFAMVVLNCLAEASSFFAFLLPNAARLPGEAFLAEPTACTSATKSVVTETRCFTVLPA